MAFPAVTNVDGSNPGPQSATQPDTVQTPVGNLWKIASLQVTLSPASVANVSGWNAIAATASTNVLTIIEFF